MPGFSESQSAEQFARDDRVGSETPKAPEVRSGEAVAQIVAALYQKVSPRIGVRLIEPSAVLTIAGLKPVADLGNSLVEESDVIFIDEKRSGIEVKARLPLGKESIGQISLMNTSVLQKQQADLPKLLQRSLRQLIHLREHDWEVIQDGAYLGYPAQALIDWVDALRTNQRDRLVEADLVSVHPAAERYAGKVPEFDYYPEHANDPEIQTYIHQARAILKAFYESEHFRTIEQQLEFQQARREVRTALDTWIQRRREQQGRA